MRPKSGTTDMDAAKIARSLTEAQKRAVLAFDGERYRTARQVGVSGSTAYSLWNRPIGSSLEAPAMLLSRDYVDWPCLSWAYRLTDLGLAVKAHLQGETQ